MPSVHDRTPHSNEHRAPQRPEEGGHRPSTGSSHGSEHPVDTTFVPPLLDERVEARFEATLTRFAADHPNGPAMVGELARHRARLASLGSLAELSRYAALGVHAAVGRLRDELDCLVADGHDDHHGPEGGHEAPPAYHGELPPPNEAVQLAAVFDLLCGASLASLGDAKRRHAYLAAIVRQVEAVLCHPLAFASAEPEDASQHASAGLRALAHRFALGDRACAPSLPASVLRRLWALAHRWSHADPVSSLFELFVGPVVATDVRPARGAPGTTVTITHGGDLPAGSGRRPSSLVVMFSPHQPAAVVRIGKAGVEVRVPERARTGPVVLVRRPGAAEFERARAVERAFVEAFPAEWSLSILGVVPLEKWGYVASIPGAPVFEVLASGPAAIRVADPKGRAVDPTLAEAGDILTFRYASPGAQVPRARVDAPAGEVLSHDHGVVTYRPRATGPVTLTVGHDVQAVDIVVQPRWSVATDRVAVPGDRSPAVIVLRLDAPAITAMAWTVRSRQGRVRVPETVRAAPGAREVEVPVELAEWPRGLRGDSPFDHVEIGRGSRMHVLSCTLACPFGAWDPPLANALAIVGVHAVVLHTGKVLYFSFDARAVNDESGFKAWFADPNAGSYQLWDPETGLAEPVRPSGRNLFCAGQSALADGTIFVAGGQDGAGAADATGKYDDLFSAWFGSNDGSHRDVHTYDPVADHWTRWPDMREGRYYPTVQTLPDGSGFVAAGLSNLQQFILSGSVWAQNDKYEIYPAGNLGTGASVHRSFASVDQYPIIRLLPGGRHLFVHKHRTTRLFDLDAGAFVAGVELLPPAPVGRQTYPMQTGYAVLPMAQGEPTRILIVGGSTAKDFDYNTQSDKPAVQGAFLFTYDPAAPERSSWRATAGTPLHPRVLADTVLLPDGTVFVVSGVAMGASAGHSSSFVLEAELFDPTTETFSTAGSLDLGHPRGYHATAVLLPDGRVAVAGSTKAYNNADPGGVTPFDDTSVQVYSPPYLFRGPRPVVNGAPAAATNGAVLTLTQDPALPIVDFMLMRPCAVTHSQDMDQRAIRLRPDQGVRQLQVTLPTDRSLAPPGYYMLFALTAERVPSRAHWIRIGEAAGQAGAEVGAPPAVLPPPIHLGKYTEHAVVKSTFVGDIVIEKIDQHCNVDLESQHGSITVLEKIDQHCWVRLKARRGVTIGQKIDQHCTVDIVAGEGVSIGQKIDQHCHVTVQAGGHLTLGQKIDGNSRANLTAGGNIHIAQKVDGGSTATLIAAGTIVIGEKVGGGAEVSWRGASFHCPDTGSGVIRVI